MSPTLATHLHVAHLELARGLPVVVQAPARDGQARPWRRGLCLGRDRVADAWVVETTGLPERVRREGDGWVRLAFDEATKSYRRAKREAAKANRLPPPEAAVWVVEGPYGWILPDLDTLAGRRHVFDVAHERGMPLPLDAWAPGVPTDFADVAAWLARQPSDRNTSHTSAI